MFHFCKCETFNYVLSLMSNVSILISHVSILISQIYFLSFSDLKSKLSGPKANGRSSFIEEIMILVLLVFDIIISI